MQTVMKAIFISYNQALTDRVNRILDELGVRGFTRWALTEGAAHSTANRITEPMRGPR